MLSTVSPRGFRWRPSGSVLRRLGGAALVAGLMTVVVPGTASAAGRSGDAPGHLARPPIHHLNITIPPAPERSSNLGVKRSLSARQLAIRPRFVSASSIKHVFTVDTRVDVTPGAGSPTDPNCAPGNKGACTLRQAIADADAAAGEVDEVYLPKGMDVRLTLGSLQLTASMFISGAGATVNGEGNEVFVVTDFPAVQINGLEITGGIAGQENSWGNGQGGGIYCDSGSLVLDGVLVTGNEATTPDSPGGEGGGIYGGLGCDLWVDNSVVSGNVADGGGGTGGAKPATSTLEPRQITVQGQITSQGSLSEPPAATGSGEGGGVYVDGSAVIESSVIGGVTAAQANVASDGGGLANEGAVTVVKTSIEGNNGGIQSAIGVGLYNDSVLAMSDDRIDHNVAPDGGEGAGLYSDWLARISASSIGSNEIVEPSPANAGGAPPASCACFDAAGTGAFIDGEATSLLSDVTFADNRSVDAAAGSVGGGALYDDSTAFDWSGGSITGTSVSDPSGEIDGGAALLEGESERIVGVTVSGTSDVTASTTGAGGEVVGGAIAVSSGNGCDSPDCVVKIGAPEPVRADPVVFDDDSISSTTATGTSVEGGAIYVSDSVATLDGVEIHATTALTSLPASAPQGKFGILSIYGGGLYSDSSSSLTLDDVTVTATTARSSAPVSLGASSYISGGALVSYGALEADRFSVTDTSVTAGGGVGEVQGGAIALWNGSGVVCADKCISKSPTKVSLGASVEVGSAVLDDSQVLGATVRADLQIYGGVLYNDDELEATNFTLGDSSVGFTGDESNPIGSKTPIWASLGSILYSDNLSNIVNGTFAGISSSAPEQVGTLSGIYSIAGAQGPEPAPPVSASESSDASGATPLQLTNSTIDDDVLAGPAGNTFLLYSDTGGAIVLRNSIVASAGAAPNCDLAEPGTLLSAGYNLDSGKSCDFDHGGDLRGVNPLLEPLAGNGGAVETVALRPRFYDPNVAGSPAIGAASMIGCPATDARGMARPQNGGCDMGAYQSPGEGYWTSDTGGQIYRFGTGRTYGSVQQLLDDKQIGRLKGRIIAIASTADHHGYYQAGADGGVFSFGDAVFHGSLALLPLPAPIVGIAADPAGSGYWLVGAEGHVYPFGSAGYYGSESYDILHETVVGMAATPDGRGYWLATSGGGVLAFGDARGFGSPATAHLGLAAPITAIEATPDGDGYWLVAANGAVFAYGDARYHGSVTGRPAAPIASCAITADGLGYWLFAANGRVYNFGDAAPLGSSPDGSSSVIGGAAAGSVVT